jgi:hypothetical protein
MTDQPPAGVEEMPAAPALTQPQEATNLLTLGAAQQSVTVHEAQDKGSTGEAQEVQRLEGELAAARAKLAESQGDTVMVRVEAPHSELHYGGVVLTSDYAPVPRSMLGALTTAANDSKATITTQES